MGPRPCDPHRMQAVPLGFELAEADDPRGVLDLRGDHLHLQLAVHGVTAALVWWYDGGSTGRYFAWTHALDEAAAHIAALERPLLGPADPRPLAVQAAAWLACLRPGRNALAWSAGGGGDPDITRGPSPGACCWYGDDGRLVETQPESRIDPAQVDRCATTIAAGERSAIVTLGLWDNGDRFLLDGHHRLRAYARLGLAPPELTIVRLDPPPIDRTDARATLREIQRGNRDLTDWVIREFLAPS